MTHSEVSWCHLTLDGIGRKRHEVLGELKNLSQGLTELRWCRGVVGVGVSVQCRAGVPSDWETGARDIGIHPSDGTGREGVGWDEPKNHKSHNCFPAIRKTLFFSKC